MRFLTKIKLWFSPHKIHIQDIESAEKFAEKREIEAYHQDQEALAV